MSGVQTAPVGRLDRFRDRAGGAFTVAEGNGANRIAQWNGTTWDAMADGFNNNDQN